MSEYQINLMQWYNAYLSAVEMMTLQGYASVDDQDGYVLEEFEDQLFAKLKATSNFDDITLQFIKPLPAKTGLESELGLVVFADAKINKEFVMGMTNFALGKASNNRIANLILIAQGGVASVDGKKLFLECAPTKVPRSEINPDIKRFWARYFSLDEMQSNPLKHALQPKYRLMIDEEEKERLRLELVKDLQGEARNKTLFELLPRDPMTNVVPTWYGAYVGDVFEITRRIGGYARYYRVVVSVELSDD